MGAPVFLPENIMSKIIAVLALMMLLIPKGAQAQTCYHLVWAEDFNYNGPPDPASWGYDLGAGGWGNNEVQNYTNSLSNAFVQDGKLTIKAIKTGSIWTSARLVTRHKRDFLYGRVEVRAKLPVGRGTWPAIWMLPTDWEYGGWPDSGEIDIMEHVGYDPGVVHGTVHTRAYNHTNGTQVGNSMQVPDFNTAFHTYAIEWTPEGIDFFIDDENYFSFANDQAGNFATWPFDKRFHLILNIAIGGDWGGAQGIDPSLTEATMEIESIKVYSATEVPAISGPDLVLAGSEVSFELPKNPAASYVWDVPSDATVVAGFGSSRITVRWGESSGEVSAMITTACGSVQARPLQVQVKTAPPDASQWEPPMYDGDSSLWYENPTQGNQLDIDLQNGDTRLAFNIQQPTNNPSMGYDFQSPVDLSGFAYFGFQMMVPENNPPRVVRLDLIDHNGSNNQHQIFRVNEFGEAGAFHYYVSPVSAASGFDLSAIHKMAFYVNYGIFGTSGQGELWLRNVFFSRENPTNVQSGLQIETIRTYPNPASDYIILPDLMEPEKLVMTDLSGRVVAEENNPANPFSISHLQNGIYLLQLIGAGTIHISKVLISR
jgi:beta-glucanase (GH16 family)